MNHHHQIALGIFLFFLGLYLLSGAGHFNATDAVGVFCTTKNLAEHGRLGQPDQLVNVGYLPILFEGRNNRYYGKYGVGQSLAAVPWYWAGLLAEKILPTRWAAFFAGYDYQYWGGELPIFAVSTFGQFITALTLVVFLAFCLSQRVPVVRAVSLVFALGIGTLFWSNSRDFFQHPLETLLLFSAIYMLARKEEITKTDFLWGGIFAGAAIITRPVQVINMLPLMLYAFYRSHKSANAPWPLWMYFVVPQITGVLLQLLTNFIRFGGLFKFAGYGKGNEFMVSNLLKGLYIYTLSPGHGLLVYATPILLGVLAFRKFWQRQRPEAALFLSLIAINLFFYSCLPNKHETDYAVYGLWCYGPRYVYLVIPFLLYPAVYFRESTKTGGAALWLTTFVGALFQLPGVVMSYSFVMNDLRDFVFPHIVEGNAVDHLTLTRWQYSLPYFNIQYFLKGEYIDIWWYNGISLGGKLPAVVSVSVLLIVMACGGILIGYGLCKLVQVDDSGEKNLPPRE